MKIRIWIAAFCTLLVASGYVFQLSFHLMNLQRDDAYIGGIALSVFWIIVILTFAKYFAKKCSAYSKEICDKEKEQQKANEKQSSAASTSVGPTSTDAVSDRMHTENRTGNGGDRS